MPAPPQTTSDQVAAYRFGLRRLRSALVRREAVPGADPVRTQGRATVVGFVLAVVVLAGSAIWGRIDRPADWTTAAIVVADDSGALYVVAHQPDRLIPVPNLASARLVLAAGGGPTGEDALDPVEVPATALAGVLREPAVGIPDAPALPAAGTPAPAVWSVCDTGSPDRGAADPWSRPRLRTTVVAGATVPGTPLAPGRGLLLRDRVDGTWLVHDGERSRLRLDDPAVVEAFGLAGRLPRPVTTSLLNTLPEGPVIARPVLAGRGSPAPWGAPEGEPIGGVLRLEGPGSQEGWYVVQTEGVQRVPLSVARLVRLSDPDPVRARAPIPTVSPNQLRGVGVARGIALETYPDPVPAPLPMAEAPTTCAGAAGGDPVSLSVSSDPVGTATAEDVPDPTAGTAPTPLAQADRSEDRVDAVVVPGGGVVVRAVPVGRADAPAPPTVVSGSGLVSPVPDPGTAAALGLGQTFAPAPDAVIGLLPAGPALTLQAAATPLPGQG